MTSAARMKMENTKRILQVVHENPGIYRKLIAKALNLSSQAITNQVEELVENGILKEVSQKTASKGRAPVSLHLNYHNLYLYSIEIRLDSLCVFFHNMFGDVIASSCYKLSGESDILQVVKDMLGEVERKVRGRYFAQAIVISVTGLVNEETGLIITAEKLGWHNVNLMEELAYMKLPVLVRNDVNLIACYEKTRCNRDMNFLVVKLDIGIGSSFFTDSGNFKNNGHVSGELGHVSVYTKDHRPCSCGKDNCLTRYISVEALEKDYGDKYSVLVEDVKAGKKEAIACVEQMCEYLIPVLANIVNLLDIDKIVLCGCTVDNFTDIITRCINEKMKLLLSYWVSYKGIEIHRGIPMTKLSTAFWFDYYFSYENAQLIIAN